VLFGDAPEVGNQVKGTIAKGSKIVAILTGNGLKDPNTAIECSPIKPVLLPNDEEAVANHIRGVVHQ